MQLFVLVSFNLSVSQLLLQGELGHSLGVWTGVIAHLILHPLHLFHEFGVFRLEFGYLDGIHTL